MTVEYWLNAPTICRSLGVDRISRAENRQYLWQSWPSEWLHGQSHSTFAKSEKIWHKNEKSTLI